MSKLGLYMRTASHLKPSQVACRVWRRLGGATPLRRGYAPDVDPAKADTSRVPALPEIDFDPAFLSRFDCDAILDGRLSLLHKERRVDWSAVSWRCRGETPLWRYNMHYCECLLPLAKRFLDAGDARYLEGARGIVLAWIKGNPRAVGGAGWDPYTISMRAVNWLAFYAEARAALEIDASFVTTMNESLAEQYAYLSRHIEKDLLANHYLENLKALVVLASYFGDDATLDLALPLFEAQVAEQILPDGAHFELSPMYQKVVLEDLLRACACLRAAGRPSAVIESRLAPMCDFVHSMERGTNRTPLFNDSGDNVAKAAASLLACARNRFDVEPEYRSSFPVAGYYLLEGHIDGDGHAIAGEVPQGRAESSDLRCSDSDGRTLKVVFDAGAPGPAYACGHAHCDMLSLEVFVNGEPWVVNSGTYAYQDESRLDFKRTAAHSAPQIEGVEQSECWGLFRMARMARALGAEVGARRVTASMCDQENNVITRSVELTRDGLVVDDSSPAGKCLVGHFHFAKPFEAEGLTGAASVPYASEFGQRRDAAHVVATGMGRIKTLLVFHADGIVAREVRT